MADPISLTLAAVGTAATVGGGITSAIGAKYAGDAKANMYQYQAGVAEINRNIQKQNAEYARSAGEVSASQAGRQTQQTMGLIRATGGASGVDVNRGTQPLVVEGQRKAGEFAQNVIRSNAARTAYGYEVKAMEAQSTGALAGMGAEAAKTEGELGAASSILGTVGSVASKWYGASSSFGTSSGNTFFGSPSFWGSDTFMPSI